MPETIKCITFNYSIIPPAGVRPDDIKIGSVSVPPSAEQFFPIASSSTSRSPTSGFYGSASTALREAQRSLNETLTPWKDAIGDREKAKEDLGKVGYGKGRGARMSVGSDGQNVDVQGRVVETNGEEDEEDEDEIPEDS